MRLRDLLAAVQGVDLDAPVEFVFHQPVACCDDPDDPDHRHVHDVPDIPCAQIDPARDIATTPHHVTITTRGA